MPKRRTPAIGEPHENLIREFRISARKLLPDAIAAMRRLLTDPDVPPSSLVKACELLFNRAVGCAIPEQREGEATAAAMGKATVRERVAILTHALSVEKGKLAAQRSAHIASVAEGGHVFSETPDADAEGGGPTTPLTPSLLPSNKLQ